jgi:nucleotide-binding universal stress UspA family protein
MTETEKIFVILDPTTMEQPSLIMAESIARDFNTRQDHSAVLHLYCAIDKKSIREDAGAESDQVHADIHERTSEWVERLAAHSRQLGLTAETEVEICPDWRKAIVASVARQNCSLAIKGLSQHQRLTRLFRDTSDWRLLRNSACPVYLVKSSPNRPVRKILAAIKHRTEKQIYTEANELILQAAHGIADGLGAELHVVTAYKNNLNYPDRQKFADRCRLPRNQVRAEMDSPEDAIAKVAKDIAADLVIIARVGKPGAKGDVGHTAEKVIDSLDANVLVLPMTE